MSWKYSAIPDGSSPRVRGTVRLELKDALAKRFIPARAGNGRATIR